MSKKILVTGGTGYIGSHTVVELQKSGYDVVVVDNLCNSKKEILQQIEKITGIKPCFELVDLKKGEDVFAMFERYSGIAGVIHFAAYKAVGESTQVPLNYYHNNLFSLINLLLAMQKHGVRDFVFSSSCTVYGNPASLPVDENAEIQPAMSPYGNTKQVSEEVLYDTVRSNETRGISLRYFNPVGAHNSGLIGELPTGVPGNLVPFITQTAIGKRDKLNVFGDDYPTPDGTCIRDYIHVEDLAKAHVIAVERMIKDKQKDNYEVFNLGTGKGYSVLEVIKTFEKVAGVQLPYEITGRRPGDVSEVWADTNYANKELGWKAEKGLEDMMKTAWMWEKNLEEMKLFFGDE